MYNIAPATTLQTKLLQVVQSAIDNTDEMFSFSISDDELKEVILLENCPKFKYIIKGLMVFEDKISCYSRYYTSALNNEFFKILCGVALDGMQFHIRLPRKLDMYSIFNDALSKVEEVKEMRFLKKDSMDEQYHYIMVTRMENE